VLEELATFFIFFPLSTNFSTYTIRHVVI